MKRLAKGIVNYAGIALLAAGFCLTPHTATPSDTPVQQAQTVPAQKKETLEKKLERIHNTLRKRGMKYISFRTTNLKYLFLIENIDKDGKPDYVLLISKMDDNSFLLGPSTIYLEDQSKETGTGNVDKTMYYAGEKETKRVVKISVAELDKKIKEYEELADSKAADKKKLSKLKNEIYFGTNYMINMNALYFGVIDGLDGLVNPKK
ncbi:hypothetical protein KY349_05005 [Candidatus Woesearchaeota archaeon]|nr:hypothetical protein [Candidatus Woesearchaeota archaeon]